MDNIISFEAARAARRMPDWEYVPLERAARSLFMDFGELDDSDLIDALVRVSNSAHTLLCS